MSTRTVGTTLRLLGPTLQVFCLIVLFTAPGANPGAGPESSGRRLFLYAGFGAGLVMVLIGNLLTRAQPRRSASHSLDLRLDETYTMEPDPNPREHG